MKVLELFCGTGSVSKICKELGWEVYSVDISDKFYPLDKKIDILKWNYKELDFKPDIIWASPPCASFSSMLNIHKHINIEERMKAVGLPLLYKAREIIDYFKPEYYFIENPDTGRMKNFITDLPFYRVCYCRYGYDNKKATRIWTNLTGFDAKWCNHKKHITHIGMTRMKKSEKHPNRSIRRPSQTVKTLKEKYSIPPELIRELFITILSN